MLPAMDRTAPTKTITSLGIHIAPDSELTPEPLSALGAGRLAEILSAEAARDRRLRRALELALAASDGNDALIASLQRLAQHAREAAAAPLSSVIGELSADRAAIVEMVGERAPRQAVDLHVTLLDHRPDPGDRLSNVFRAGITGRALSDRLLERLSDDPHGLYDGLITALADLFDEDGLDMLESELRRRRDARLRADGRRPSRTDGILATLEDRLRELADLRGDVDAYLDTYSEADLENPKLAAAVAQRLTDADRAQQALAILDRAPPDAHTQFFGESDWTNARIAALEASGHYAEAQDLRLASFPSTLSAAHLRAYLVRLADFDDQEIERRARDFVDAHPSVSNALAFLVAWLAQQRPARFAMPRAGGADYNGEEQLLLPAAQTLEKDHPLAAVVLSRAQVEDALVWTRQARYPDVARQARALEQLDAEIGDYDAFETHEQFVARLRREHPRKGRFWSQVDDAAAGDEG